MERKIREDFGVHEEEESVRKRRRFWSLGVRVRGDEVPLFAPMPDVHVHRDTSLEAWPAGEMVPVVLPGKMQEGERGQKRGRIRTESLASETSHGVSLSSFGSFGSRTSKGSHTGDILRWARGLFGQSSQRIFQLDWISKVNP